MAGLKPAFARRLSDSGLEDELARAICPRGAVDLALAFHARGDAAMLERITSEDLSGLKFRDKIAAAVRFRLQAVRGQRGGAPGRDIVRPADPCGGWGKGDLGNLRPDLGPRWAIRRTT